MEVTLTILNTYFEGKLEAEQACVIESLYEKDATFRDTLEEFYCTHFLLKGLHRASLLDVEAALSRLRVRLEERSGC